MLIWEVLASNYDTNNNKSIIPRKIADEGYLSSIILHTLLAPGFISLIIST